MLLVLVGCAPPVELPCPLPNKQVGDTCCLDQDNDGVCDQDTPAKPEPLVEPNEPARNFGKTFISFWSRKDFKTLYELFTSDLQDSMTKTEFEYFASIRHELDEIKKVELEQVSKNQLKYRVITEDATLHVVADIVQEGEDWKHTPFFFFENLDLENVCRDKGEMIKLKDCDLPLNTRDRIGCILDTTYSCFMDFAVLTEDAQYCDEAGHHKTLCLQRLGEDVPLEDQIIFCQNHADYHDEWDCLINLGKEYVAEEPCALLEYDIQRYECFGHVAAGREDASLCEEFVLEYDFYVDKLKEAYCLKTYAEELDDESICHEIITGDNTRIGDLKEKCVFNVKYGN